MEYSPTRTWFLTWRTYGTWLPGDERGFIGAVRDDQGNQVINNIPGQPVNRGNVRLESYAASRLKGPPILLTSEHAVELEQQFYETAQYRGWSVLGLAILINHVHLVVLVEGDPDGSAILRDFKSFASRRLNARFGKPASGSWWSESGSRRVVKADANHEAVEDYVKQQSGAFLIRIHRPADTGRSPDSPAG
jgi:REP element-mobilizing transposase RayT